MCLSFLAVKMNLNESEQGTVPHEFSEYDDSSSALRFLSTNIQVIDLPICPSLPQFVVMQMLTDARGSFFSSTPQTAAFAKSVHDDIYERVRRLANWHCQ